MKDPLKDSNDLGKAVDTLVGVMLFIALIFLLDGCNIKDEPYFATKEDGCGAPVIQDSIFDSYFYHPSCHVEGDLNLAHYEVFKEFEHNKARNVCVLFTNKLITQFKAMGEKPQIVMFYPKNNIDFERGLDHAAVYLDGLVYDNGAVTKGFHDAFPVDDLLHKGAYEILPYR